MNIIIAILACLLILSGIFSCVSYYVYTSSIFTKVFYKTKIGTAIKWNYWYIECGDACDDGALPLCLPLLGVLILLLGSVS